jgi:hypothetical protein
LRAKRATPAAGMAAAVHSRRSRTAGPRFRLRSRSESDARRSSKRTATRGLLRPAESGSMWLRRPRANTEGSHLRARRAEPPERAKAGPDTLPNHGHGTPRRPDPRSGSDDQLHRQPPEGGAFGVYHSCAAPAAQVVRTGRRSVRSADPETAKGTPNHRRARSGRPATSRDRGPNLPTVDGLGSGVDERHRQARSRPRAEALAASEAPKALRRSSSREARQRPEDEEVKTATEIMNPCSIREADRAVGNR